MLRPGTRSYPVFVPIRSTVELTVLEVVSGQFLLGRTFGRLVGISRGSDQSEGHRSLMEWG
jgi:hypothetical protein